MAYDIYRLANMLLKWANYEGDPLTNRRLQVLPYYEQGYHLAHFNKPLFSEKIKSLVFGSGAAVNSTEVRGAQRLQDTC